MPSDKSELVLAELRGVEERAKANAQQAIAELTELFERRIAELKGEIAERDNLIRKLQRGSLESISADQELGALVAQLGRDMRVEVQRAVEQTLDAKAAAAGADSGSTAARSEGRSILAKSSGASVIIAGIVAGVLMFIQSRCSEPPKEPARAVELVPHPKQPNPNNPAGIP